MDRIGEYLIRRQLGEGGMGKVYEGEERLSKRPVALKVLREELTGSKRARRLFLNEMEILAQLEHPNIVRSLASIEADGKLVMVLEYLQGRTLRQLLSERGRLPWDEAIQVVASIARALGAAHSHEPPVVHRDLKPENIMISDDGAVKVMDFGVAKLLQELDQTNTQTVGTLQYMSPEQIDARSIDHRSDLYCLGLIYYELLAGEPPFSCDSPRGLLNMQCIEPAPPLADEVRSRLSRGLETLLDELLDKHPDGRPDSALEVVARLEPFMPSTAEPSAHEPGRLSGRLSRPARREPRDTRKQGGQEGELAAPAKGAGEGAAVERDEPVDRGTEADGGEGGDNSEEVRGEKKAAAGSWHATSAKAAWLGQFELEKTGMAAGASKTVAASPKRKQQSPEEPDAPGLTEPAKEPPVGPQEPEPQRPAGLATLLETMGRARELSTTTSLIVICVLAIVAGLATYLWRSSATDELDEETVPSLSVDDDDD